MESGDSRRDHVRLKPAASIPEDDEPAGAALFADGNIGSPVAIEIRHIQSSRMVER